MPLAARRAAPPAAKHFPQASAKSRDKTRRLPREMPQARTPPLLFFIRKTERLLLPASRKNVTFLGRRLFGNNL